MVQGTMLKSADRFWKSLFISTWQSSDMLGSIRGASSCGVKRLMSRCHASKQVRSMTSEHVARSLALAFEKQCILMHLDASCLSPSYHLVIPCPRCPRSWPGQASESPWRQTNWRDCRDAAKRGGFSLLFGFRSSWFLTNSQKQVIFSDCNEGKLCVTR